MPKVGSKHRKPKEQVKGKAKHLAILIDEFLEKEIEREHLISKPDEIQRLKKLLEDELWQNNIDPNDPYWKFESDFAMDHSERYTDQELQSANIEEGIGTILYYHRLLKSFWDDFKKKIQAFHEVREEMEQIQTEWEAVEGIKTFDDWKGMRELQFDVMHRERGYPIEIKIPFKLDYETGEFHSEGALMTFMGLLENISIGNLKKCKNDRCGKWFVLTSKHKKEYCRQRCASNHYQAKFREEHPEEFKALHREFYNQNYKKKTPSSSKGGVS